MAEQKNTIWTRMRGNTSRDPILIGRKISPEWLKEEVSLIEFSFGGQLFNAFSTLLSTAKQEKKNLPVTSLRTALIAGMDRIVRLDRDLGLIPDLGGKFNCAIAMFPDIEDDEKYSKAREAIARYLGSWVMNDVEPWAERNGLGALAAKLKKQISAEDITGTMKMVSLMGDDGKSPDFALIARRIAERLIGEELFAGMKECELVASPESLSNSIELMTLPKRASRGEDVFSMVARLTVCTMPYNNDLYLGISAAKRVWSKKVPFANPKMPKRVTGYVMSAGRPAIMVSVERTESGWAFGDSYASVQQESGFSLPETLEAAVIARDFNPDVNWWVGLPELPTLFKFVSPRTVFEGDEASLQETVTGLLGAVLIPKKIPLREIPLSRKKKPLQEMLRLADLDFGAAGDSLVSEPEGDETSDPEDEESGQDRGKNLQHYREQNIRALMQRHGENKPLLWVLCNSTREREIIENTVKKLFGDAVDINAEPLPTGTHGLRTDLDGSNQKASVRFVERIRRWAPAAAKMQEISAGRPIIALICAADKYNQRNEDPVNYYAGIHAMSKIGANVHHVLPIETPDDEASEQSFLHRTQSALLDVFLAHSGIIFGTKEFAAQLLPADGTPRCIYGFQAIRSRARSRSGETGVTFILNTRLVIETGVTEVQYVYKTMKGTARSKWMPLSEGLQWLGSQRQLHEGDDRWLRQVFEDETKQTLFEISQEDPKAIVMIDWQSLAGLWKGMRDTELVVGSPLRIGNTDLSLFKEMTFVRLRRGANTLSLRTEVKISFEGWLDSEENSRIKTGENLVDAYYTTEKELVEVSDEVLISDRPYGHFISTMGYAKTVQVKRGFSCYRPMPRMHKIKGTNEFEQKMLDPAGMDASLPAAMEITVISAPKGILASNIAMLVMGLRIGYAHYNEWTGLPAPLFFRRKIEDYVIRFPEDEDMSDGEEVVAQQDSVATVDVAIAETEGGLEKPTFIARLIDNEAKEGEQTTEETQSFVTLTSIGGVNADENELLACAKAAVMPILHSTKDMKLLNLGRRMLHQDTNVRVRVSLPYWFKSHGAFGEYSPVIRRNASRCWRRMREFNIVSASAKMPKESEFLNWMTRLLQVPHACHALAPACLEIGGLHFVRFAELINKTYNAEKPPEEQASTYSLTPELVRSMATWANENGNDELMAWLIFQVAQYPHHGFCEAVMESITRIPGPMTEESLNYYLDVIWALDNAIAQKDHISKFQAVLRRRNPPAHALIVEETGDAIEAVAESPVIAEVTTDAAEAAQEDAQYEISQEQSPPPVEVTTKAHEEVLMNPDSSYEQGSLVSIKTRLSQLVESICPGADDFHSLIADFNAQIESLSILHERERERNDVAAQLRERFASLKENCDLLISKLENIKEELSLGQIRYVEPESAQLDVAEDSIVSVQSIIEDIEALRKQAAQFESMPVPSSFDERLKRKKIIADAWEAISDSRTNLINLIDQSPCLDIESGSPDPEGGEHVDEPVSEPVAPETVAAQEQKESAPGVVEQAAAEEISVVEEVQAEAGEVIEVHGAAIDAPSVVETVEASIASAEQDVVEVEVPPQAVEQKAPPVAVAQPTPVITADDDFCDDEAIEESDPVVVEFQTEVLHRLIGSRMFGMAAVHVEAMKYVLAEFSGNETNAHYVVLHALVDSLERMDCQFEFDPKVDQNLKEFLANETLSGDSLCDPVSLALGVMTAGLSSMLFDCSDDQWNIGNAIGQRLVGHEAVTKLIEHVDTLRQRGLVLTRDMFAISHVGDQEALRQEIHRYQQRAAKWKTDNEIYSSYNHRGFKALHESMFSTKSVIGACLELIAKGDDKKVPAAYEEARRKLEKGSNTVDEHFRSMGEKSRPDGMYRTRAIENIETTKRFIEEYLDMLRRKENPNVELVKSIQMFLASLHRKLEDAISEIEQIPAETALAKVYRDSALSALRCALRLFDNTQAPACIPQIDQKLLVQVPLNRDLMPVLGRIDEHTPEICSHWSVLEETERWSNEHLTFGGEGDSVYVALRDAMRLHINAQRFLPAFMIEQRLPRNMLSETEPLIQLYNKRKAAFVGELQNARQRVTHAMTLSALTQNEANQMQRVIAEMEVLALPDRGIGHPQAERSVYPDFPQATAALRHNVLNPLEARLSQTAAQLRDELDRYAKESSGISSPQDIQRVREMLNSENAATLRTAYDSMMLLKNTHKLPPKLGVVSDIASTYDKLMADVFKSVHSNKPSIEALMEALSREPKDDEPEWLAAMDIEQRQEGVKIIESWLKLFQSQRRNVMENTSPLEKVFHNLGIAQEPWVVHDLSRTNRLRFMLPERSFTFPTSDDETFIPPILGSRATNIQGYMVFGSVQETELRQMMHEVGGNPTVVLARTRLNMQKRARVSAGAPVLIIDDDLISYIAIHPNERLQALLRIAILTFGTNPYDDYGGNPVPPEMFFGRQKELDRLRNVKSLGVLYGGRRLGKSSLLSQIEHENSDVPGRKAVYISMDTVDSSTNHVFSAWDFVYRNLMSRGIIAPLASPAKKWEDFRDWIHKEITANKNLNSLYLLIDEADALMECELRLAKGAISFVRSLQQMVETLQHTCYIRYVIAGLHNMTRMTNEENSVLGGKAETIALEPFNTPADMQRGIRLITKPLAAMGYLFGEGAEDLPLRILSVCNFYPAFIQLYCKSLVDRLQNRRQERVPPLYINADDLRAVEDDSNLLNELRRKFESNLDLDKRYKAIALILADSYYSEIESGHYSGLTIPEIKDMCETFAPHHFANSGSGVCEALLDEMTKLNVVEREGARYVLRNPNIAMMMGDADRVAHRLDELAREPSVDSRNLGERRIKMEYGSNSMLFPFPVAWVRRYMDPSDGELLIVTGNDVSGILDLAQPSTKEEWSIGQGQDIYTVLPVSGPTAANDYINLQLNMLRKGKKQKLGNRIVAIRQNNWSIAQIPEYASVAAKAAKAGVRFILLAMPERAFDLAMAIEKGLLNPKGQNWRVVPIPQWTEDAVYFKMHENSDVSENSGAIASIIEASCGFHKEVLQTCSAKMSVDEAMKAPEKARALHGKSLADFYKRIGLPAGFTNERREECNGFIEAIDGAQRLSAEVDEVREMQNVSKAEMDFMHWMGLLQDGAAGTWRVPPLYAELIKNDR